MPLEIKGIFAPEQKNAGTSRKGHVNVAVTPDGRTDESGKVSPLERTKLGQRLVGITKCPRDRAERAPLIADLAYKYTNKIVTKTNHQLLVRVFKKVNTTPMGYGLWAARRPDG
jgi:hypothetical protein